MLAPAERPILWPEHFDVGITVARVNYGLSPGDAAIDEPYATSALGARVVRGSVLERPFGAAQRLTGLGRGRRARLLPRGSAPHLVRRAAMSAICAGPTRQQPPTSRAPCATQLSICSGAYDARPVQA